MQAPDVSNLNATASAAVGTAMTTIANYLSAAPTTDAQRANAVSAAQKLNELVAALNSFAAS